MLPKNNRLNLKKDFKWVASGQKVESMNFKLFLRLGDNLKPRVGISLSKNVLKKAVDRNRAKRLLSTAFKNLYSSLLQNINIVALPKPGIISLKSTDIEKELEETLRKFKFI